MLTIRQIISNPSIFLGKEVKVDKKPSGYIMSLRFPPFIENKFEGSDTVLVCDGLSPIEVGSSIHISSEIEIEEKSLLLLASGIVSVSSPCMIKIKESIITFIINGADPLIYPTTVPYDVDLLRNVGMSIPDLDLAV